MGKSNQWKQVTGADVISWKSFITQERNELHQGFHGNYPVTGTINPVTEIINVLKHTVKNITYGCVPNYFPMDISVLCFNFESIFSKILI